MKKQAFLKNVIFILFLAITLFLIVLIFKFSSENSAESNDTSYAFIETIFKIFIKDYENLPPNIQLGYLDSFNSIVRIFGHFSIFAALGFSSAGTFRFLRVKLSLKQKYLFALLFGFLNAIFDEIHQYFIPGRAFQFSDIVTDSLGLILGCFTFTLFLYLANKIFKNKFLTLEKNV